MYRTEFYQHVIAKMSPTLQGLVAHHQHGKWIESIPFFNASDENERERFMTEVALALVPCAHAPNELIYGLRQPADCMYIVDRGVVGTENRVRTTGGYFGIGMILSGATRQSPAIAMCFVDLFILRRVALVTLLDSNLYPETKKMVRKMAIRHALRVKMQYILRLIKCRPDYISRSKAHLRRVKDHYKALELKRQTIREHKETVNDDTRPVPQQGQGNQSNLSTTHPEEELDYLVNGFKQDFTPGESVQRMLKQQKNEATAQREELKALRHTVENRCKQTEDAVAKNFRSLTRDLSLIKLKMGIDTPKSSNQNLMRGPGRSIIHEQGMSFLDDDGDIPTFQEL